MDRYAIFVDAGYVYASGGALVLDTSNRNQVDLNHPGFIQTVRQIVEAEFPNSGDFLRVYWYDAAPRGVPQSEHEQVAAHAGVKVRLGRLTRQGQKGVDSLVLRDMMKLSAEHAICTAFLVAGDEDLRQGVVEAQDYGVKVVLIGIEPTFGGNQARSLIEEADELRTLGYSEMESCISSPTTDSLGIVFDESFDAFAVGSTLGEEVGSREETSRISDGDRIPADLDAELIRRLLEVGDLPGSVQLPATTLSLARDGLRTGIRAAVAAAQVDVVEHRQEVPAAGPAPATAPPPALAPSQPEPLVTPDGLAADYVWAFREGMEFGQAWLNEQPQDEARYIRANFPSLPRDIDSELLRRMVREMGLPHGARIEDAERKAARAGFWQALGMELDFGGSESRRARFDPIDESDPVEFGRAFARQWAAQSARPEIVRAQNLVEKRIGLPSDADGTLLRLAAARFGDPVPVEVRHRLREGFGRELAIL